MRKNAQVFANLLTPCNRLVQQADVRMCLHHGLRQLVVQNRLVATSPTLTDLTSLLQLVDKLRQASKMENLQF